MEIEKAIQQKKFSSDRERSVVNILYTSSWLANLQNQVFKKYDISMQQFNLMRILKGQHPKPASVNLLIERMIDKSSNASRIVEKLRMKNLVERKTCPNDRRQVDVVITDAGIKLLAACNTELDQIQLANDQLTSEEHKELNRLLNKLRS